MGETDASNPAYETNNALCYSGDPEGMVSCITPAEGRYITIMINSADFVMKFAEIFAFESVDLASNSINLNSMTVESGILTSIVGTSDQSLFSNERCVDFDPSSDPMTSFTIDLVESSFVTGVFIASDQFGQDFYPTVGV